MIKHFNRVLPVLSILFILFDSSKLDAQNFVATVKPSHSLKKYLHILDSSITLIDFMKVPEKERPILFQKCKGLILGGGNDVNPNYFGRPDLKKYCYIEPSRDILELQLIERALLIKMPILGICRGMQMINVAMGGDLNVDIPLFHFTQHKRMSLKHKDINSKKDVIHSLSILENTHLFKLMGTKNTIVNSRHHQAVNNVAPLLIVSAKGPDGVIEGIESRDIEANWILGVQWHPERFYHLKRENFSIAFGFIEAMKLYTIMNERFALKQLEL